MQCLWPPSAEELPPINWDKGVESETDLKTVPFTPAIYLNIFECNSDVVSHR